MILCLSSWGGVPKLLLSMPALLCLPQMPHGQLGTQLRVTNIFLPTGHFGGGLTALVPASAEGLAMGAAEFIATPQAILQLSGPASLPLLEGYGPAWEP